MKDLGNKFMANFHWLIVAYTLYSCWVVFEEHTVRMDELNVSMEGLEAEVAASSKKVREIQEFIKKAEESKVRVEEVAKNIESAQKQLPADINDNQIITFFNEEIQTLNIKDPNITPGTEQTSTYFIAKEYAVKARGTFLQFLVFLESVGNATRIYNVKKLTLSNMDASQRGRFHLITADIIIEAFRYNPEFKLDRGVDTSPGTPAAPASTPEP